MRRHRHGMLAVGLLVLAACQPTGPGNEAGIYIENATDRTIDIFYPPFEEIPGIRERENYGALGIQPGGGGGLIAVPNAPGPEPEQLCAIGPLFAVDSQTGETIDESPPDICYGFTWIVDGKPGGPPLERPSYERD